MKLQNHIHLTSHLTSRRGHGDAVWALQSRVKGGAGAPKRADWVALAEEVAATAASALLEPPQL